MGCGRRGTPLAQSSDWSTVAAAIDAVPFLKAPSRRSHSYRLAPGENLIFTDRAVATIHGRTLLGGIALEAWLRCCPVHLSIVGGVVCRCPTPLYLALGVCVVCGGGVSLFSLSVVIPFSL